MRPIKKLTNKIYRSIRYRIYSQRINYLEGFLAAAQGIIHIGANRGQEADFYATKGLPVIWIEPIPEVYKQLQSKIAPFLNQTAICALITDSDDKTYQFKIASNNGASSSIFQFKDHETLYPNIHYTDSMEIRGIKLDTLIEKEKIEISLYDTLIMDTQGSELLVLKGAEKTLQSIRYIKLEVADFESYSDGVTLDEIEDFFKQTDFKKSKQIKTDGLRKIGYYYEILFERR